MKNKINSQNVPFLELHLYGSHILTKTKEGTNLYRSNFLSCLGGGGVH